VEGFSFPFQGAGGVGVSLGRPSKGGTVEQGSGTGGGRHICADYHGGIVGIAMGVSAASFFVLDDGEGRSPVRGPGSQGALSERNAANPAQTATLLKAPVSANDHAVVEEAPSAWALSPAAADPRRDGPKEQTKRRPK